MCYDVAEFPGRAVKAGVELAIENGRAPDSSAISQAQKMLAAAPRAKVRFA